MAKAPSSYDLFVSALQDLRKADAPKTFPRIVLLHGPSEFLIFKATTSLKEKWRSFPGTGLTTLDARECDRERIFAATELPSLFEPHMMTVVRGCEKKADIAKFLAEVPTSPGLKSHLIVTHWGKGSPARFLEQAKRLGGQTIACFDPSPYEINKFIVALAKKSALDLDADAVELLKATQGHDLFRLENEITKLALVFADTKHRLRANDIASSLGVLREDQVFALDDLLMKREGARAGALVTALLDRGEKAPAILGVLALHCRRALRIHADLSANVPERDTASRLRLPPSVLRGYNRYVMQTPMRRFMRGLVKCQEADVLFKTSRTSESAILQDVIYEITH